LLAAMAAMGVLLCTSLGGQTKPNAVAVERGRKVFVQNCGFCHGPDALGGEGPSLIRSTVVRHDVNGELIRPIVSDGRPEGGMPPVPLPADQLADVVEFLHARIIASDRPSPARPGNYEAKLLLIGNAAAGKSFFDGAGRCTACHSPTGDLRGIAHKYSAPDLQARMLYPVTKKKTEVTVTLPSGEKVTGSLVYQSNFDIAIDDGAGWYRSWPRDSVKADIKDPLEAHRELLSKYTDVLMHDMFAYLETLE
jgi:cytochrome c oxidase cbb3-type subunit 3